MSVEAPRVARYRGVPQDARLEIRRGMAKCLAALLIILFVIGTSWQSVFKQPIGFALFAMVMTAMTIAPGFNPSTQARTQALKASLIFVSFGVLILFLSAMHVFQIDPTLPFRSDFMLRQAYFLFLWAPFLIGAASFWNAVGAEIFAICRRWGLPILVFLAVADLATSRLLGNPDQLVWVDYQNFLDKFGFQFIFSLTYLIYISYTRHWIICLGLLLVYGAATKLFHAGVMFNATTGAIFFLSLVTSTIPFGSRRLKAIAVCIIYLMLVVFLALGVFFPDLFAQDNNDEWRLMAWRSNFAALWHSGLAGVGFGTPYFSLTSDNMLNALTNQFNSLSADLVNSTDPQYVRAQHSSIVNVFYRMGVIGGSLFLYLNFVIVRIGFSSLRTSDPAIARLAYAALVTFIVQAVQMTVHVGLETPIYLSIYMFCTAFVLHVNALAGAVSVRMVRRPAGVTAALGLR